jgi:hypothetical protein
MKEVVYDLQPLNGQFLVASVSLENYTKVKTSGHSVT